MYAVRKISVKSAAPYHLSLLQDDLPAVVAGAVPAPGLGLARVGPGRRSLGRGRRALGGCWGLLYGDPITIPGLHTQLLDDAQLHGGGGGGRPGHSPLIRTQ